MSNLLPQKQQKTLKAAYNVRRFGVIFSLLCVILLVSLVLLFPSYLLSKVRATGVSMDLETFKKTSNTENQNGDLEVRLRDAKDKARALQISEKNPSVYELFRIFENKSRSIKIKEVSYLKGLQETTIAIQGRAASRESLTEFEKQLRSNVNFSGIDLPISNFAKEKDIDFTIDIKVKNTAQ